VIRAVGQIVLTLISFAAIPQAQAPAHTGLPDKSKITVFGTCTGCGVNYRLLRVVTAISKAENCLRWSNPGCLRAKNGEYRVFESIEAGMRALEHEVIRRRGRTIRQILESYNPNVPGYPEFVARVGRLDLEEIIR
jgi:hypothetical protein